MRWNNKLSLIITIVVFLCILVLCVIVWHILIIEVVEIRFCLSEFHLVHTNTCIVMKEGLSPET